MGPHRRATAVRAAIAGACMLLAAGGCASSTGELRTEPPTIAGASAPSQPADDAPTVVPFDGSIPEGGIALVPDGPYEAGQSVTVVASSDHVIDLYNSYPRLCARVGDDPEVCDPSWLEVHVVQDPAMGPQAVTVELPRRHFGPAGEHDCSEPDLSCRLLWRTEAGKLLGSPVLTYTATEVPQPSGITLDVSAGPEPGTVVLQPAGIDPDAEPTSVLTERELAAINESVESLDTAFRPERLEVTWELGSLCGFGEGEPTIGSEDLVDHPSWWRYPTVQPSVDGTDLAGYFGPNCDHRAVEGAIDQSDPNGPITARVHRDIYGYGGWIDCAQSLCYAEVRRQWTYPMADGSTVGSDLTVARAFVDLPDDLPRSRPTITVVEPGPFQPGQVVTVEVRGYRGGDQMAIAWCGGGDTPCLYNDAIAVDGALRSSWTLPGPGSGCGPNRCYFAINSNGEGLAPPAITIVPIPE